MQIQTGSSELKDITRIERIGALDASIQTCANINIQSVRVQAPIHTFAA